MSLEYPNYYNSADRALYYKLWNESFERELTPQEDEFIKSMYHMEEVDAGLDGDDLEAEEE